MPKISTYYTVRKPSDNRIAQMEFAERKKNDLHIQAINVSVGNVSLPMHPKMLQRMSNLTIKGSPFDNGIVKYTQTAGLEETQEAFKHILKISGYDADRLFIQITDGGSLAMELMLLGVSDADDRPVLFIDAVYTNYLLLAKRTCRKTVSIQRTLDEQGKFSFPDLYIIEETIKKYSPSAIVIIPYDNPTGQLYDRGTILAIARLCIKYDMRIVSDEAYRELYYDGEAVSIRGLTEYEVPGITGRRISIESASKVRNACGLRIGALITDNPDFHEKCVAEQTANLCANTIGQYIFGALAEESKKDLDARHEKQRSYYGGMFQHMKETMKSLLPGIIVADSQAAIYTVVDVRNLVPQGFKAQDFVLFCAREGAIEIDNQKYTLLLSPMAGFYLVDEQNRNPGDMQMRIAFVQSAEVMEKVPYLFAHLLMQYLL